MKKLLLFILIGIFISSFGHCQIPLDGLVGNYQLNDGIYTDTSGSGFHLEEVGAGGTLEPWENRFGQANKALSLLGEYLNLASNPAAFNFDSDSNFSLCIWIFLFDPVVDWAGLLNNWDTLGPNGYYLGLNPNNQVRFNVGGPNPIDSPQSIVTKIWTHIVVTYDGLEASIFINGELVQTGVNGTPISASPFPFTVGTQADSPLFSFSGVIDDILVYDRDLSSQEIMDIFAVLSIEDIDAFSSQIKVFPNPVESSLSITYNRSLGTIKSYTITDMDGRLIFESEFIGPENTVNLNTLSAGMYLLTLKTIDGFSITKKIIKK